MAAPGTIQGYDLLLTTVFSQPTACTENLQLTQLPAIDYEPFSGTDIETPLWYNYISIAPNVLATSCYPSQFWSSILAPSSVSLPAFQQLICPGDWESYNLTANYVVCCPNGFQLISPNVNDTNRPGLDAVCYSSLAPGELYDLVEYSGTSSSFVPGTTAGTNGAVVQAYAFDGTIASTTLAASAPMTAAANTSPATSTGGSTTIFTTISPTAAQSTPATKTSKGNPLGSFRAGPLLWSQLFILVSRFFFCS